MSIIGHQLVNADCNRFKPMKAVNQSHSGLTKWAKSKLINKNVPAIPRSVRSIIHPPLLLNVHPRISERVTLLAGSLFSKKGRVPFLKIGC